MVMEVGVRDSDPVGRVGDVNQAVVVVLVLTKVTAHIEVIEPDVGGILDGEAIAPNDLAELQVANDDVLDTLDGKIDAGDGYYYGLLASLWPNSASLGVSYRHQPSRERSCWHQS
jgi:hypothetical protein